MAKIIATETGYQFDAQDGSELVSLKVWLEKSKASEKHPDGKPWIILPAGNITNRKYFSEDLFNETAVNGEVEVEIKTSAPRVLGATGVKQDVIKFLDEETAAEYTAMVEAAVAEFKDSKMTVKRKKVDEMNVEELQAYIDALNNGTKVSIVSGPKSFLDVMSTEDYDRYNEILAIAAENKANAPKATRRALTEGEKQARSIKRKQTEINKAQALLAALMGIAPTHVEEYEEDAE
jgi:hypothetical protein